MHPAQRWNLRARRASLAAASRPPAPKAVTQIKAPTKFTTSLGGVSLGPNISYGKEKFSSVDDLIKNRTPVALDLIAQGTAEQLRLARQGIDTRAGALQPYTGTEALEEQNALVVADRKTIV